MTHQELINNPDFSELATVEYKEVKNFVFTELKNNHFWTLVTRIYQITGAITFLLVVIQSVSTGVTQNDWSFLISAGVGLFFSFTLLILLHELIHMAAYRCIGIRKLSMGMNLSQFEFFVQADCQVIGYNECKKVAHAPALIISLATITGAIIWANESVSFAFLSVFSVHSFLCTGDFGLLCFFDNRSELEIVTFDLTKERKACFYGKNKNIQYKKHDII